METSLYKSKVQKQKNVLQIFIGEHEIYPRMNKKGWGEEGGK